MTSSAAHDVVAYLAIHMADLTVGTNLRVDGPDWEVPSGRSALSVGVVNTLGLPVLPYLDGGERGGQETAGVMIHVRADKDDAATGEALALRILDVLSMQAVAPFFDCRVSGDGVNRLGPDASGFPRFSINLLLTRTLVYQPIYTGPVDPAATVNEALVTALASAYRTRRNHVAAVTTTSIQAAMVAMPASMGTPAFFDGATSRTTLAMTLVATISVTVRGVATSYSVWRSATGAASRMIKIL